MVNWIPERQDVIWIDCSPQIGREMRNRHPFVVLSPKAFNDKTSLVLGLPMTTAEYNKDNPFAVVVGKTKKRELRSLAMFYAINLNLLIGVFVVRRLTL